MRPLPPAAVPLAAALAALLACGEKKPEMVVAAPAAPAPAPSVPPAPAAEPPRARGPGAGPAGPPGSGAAPTSAELLAQVDALKDQLAGAPKTVEILTALGDLYYEHQRLPEALSWYDQSVAAAQPTWKGYLSLPAAARAAAPAPAAREACARGPARGHAELAADARGFQRKGDRAKAAACYRAALEPAILAEVHRANAWFLAGEAGRAIAAQESVLERAPGHPEAQYFLGLFLADTAGEDVAQLRRARALLEEVRQGGPSPQRAADLRNATEEIDRRLAEGGMGAAR